MIVIMSLQAFSTWAWADGVRPARLRSRLARSRERERAERRKQRDGAAVRVCPGAEQEGLGRRPERASTSSSAQWRHACRTEQRGDG